MEFLSGLALVLLTLVGYSGGAVLAGRRKVVTPTLFDLGMVVALWTVALSIHNSLGHWLAILVWVVTGLIVGGALAALRRGRYPDSRPSARPAVASPLRRVWEGWKAFATAMGNFQSRMWLALFYFVVITPFGVLARLFSDPLRIRPSDSALAWIERIGADTNLEDGRRQF